MEKQKSKVLGKKGRDKITNFEGIIVGYAKHLFGCDSLWLTPEVDKDGKMRDGHWFDAGRIEIIGKGVKPKDVKADTNGAGYLAPPQMR